MRRIAPLLAVALLLGACGDDDDTAPTIAPSTAESTPSVPTSEGAVTSATTESPATTALAPDATPQPTGAASTMPPSTVVAAASAYPAQPAGVPFPTSDWPTAPLPAGVDQAAIDAAVDVAFGAPDNQARVRSVVVVQGGSIVYERYHPLDGPDVVMDSYSVAKSFTSALVGLLVTDGALTLDEHPPRPEWQAPGDPRQAITLRELMQMSSGLEWTEEYGPDSLALEMLASPDAAALMAAQPLETEPGSTFEYSTGTTALVSGIAADALGGCAAETDYLHQRLLDPLGITTEQLITDGGGCFVGGVGLDMTTRDFARFGLLYLRGGRWDGQQILPTSWIDESRVPSATNPSYGLQWWLNPDGTSFSAEGAFGQRIVIVPGSDLLIVINSTPGGDPFRLTDAIRAAFGA
jgi:CubicO group peptidase (beta-lactamase class C family)